MLERKITFKLPPTTIRDVKLTQEARRFKALEEQKQRRAQRIDSARQLDVFADLTLSDDDEDEDEQTAMAPSTGVASFMPAMKEHTTMPAQILQSNPKDTGKKKHKKKRRGARANKPSKWADKCMYAELLEMVDPAVSSFDPDMVGDTVLDDGLPKDLETDWVAVTPVPVGKRCLAVTYQSSGVAGVAPNTTLRSRLLGKTLIARFPSGLPPHTILDCILDANWKDNGILHVLDVIKWKGQDVADCEARFRFWWRDTRLAEISQSTPSMAGYQGTVPLPMVSVPPHPMTAIPSDSPKYQFTYPTTFLPIPYHTDTSLSTLHEQLIPSTRTMRHVVINIPVFSPGSLPTGGDGEDGGGMDVDATCMANRVHTPSSPRTFSFSFAHSQVDPAPPGKPPSFTAGAAPAAATAIASVQVSTSIKPDGLLLYVAESGYETGTSPLSSWIPIVGYEKGKGDPKTDVKREKEDGDVVDGANKNGCGPLKRTRGEGPLDLFERLVEQRLKRKIWVQEHGGMDMDI
ncbi:hypothetical protein APHAL10511_008369 [Amanita phalloides]|nr:hypothetical protein APHAL10511_008369 [Amanita phalloides]